MRKLRLRMGHNQAQCEEIRSLKAGRAQRGGWGREGKVEGMVQSQQLGVRRQTEYSAWRVRLQMAFMHQGGNRARSWTPAFGSALWSLE